METTTTIWHNHHHPHSHFLHFHPSPIDDDSEKVECVEPIAYLWDGSNAQEAIFKQVADFCGYELPEGKTQMTGTHLDPVTGANTPFSYYKEHLDFKETYWPKIWQAIRYITNVTCWGDSDLETFLLSCRKQTVEVDVVCRCDLKCKKCDEEIVEIQLDYSPTPERPFVGGSVMVVKHGHIHRHAIGAKYLNDHYDRATGKLYLNRFDFYDLLIDECRACADCELKVTIELQYNAGYEAIPDGLLPLICPIVSKIDEAKIGLSNCHQAMTQVVGLLKRKKVGNVEYEWSNTDSNTQKTMNLYSDIYNIATVDEVMALSRCYMAETVSEIGDVV